MATFQATIKWGFCDAEPDAKTLPNEFADAKRLWAEKNPNAFTILEKFLRCYFIPVNVFCDCSEILDIEDDVEATNVQVYGADFKGRELPQVKAIAFFDIETKGNISCAAFEAWQEEHEQLDNGVVFQWDLIDIDEDVWLINHEGLSFEMVSLSGSGKNP